MYYIASDNQEQKRMRVFLRVYPSFIFVFFFLYGGLSAQDLEPGYVEAKVLQGTTYSLELISSGKVSVVTRENFGNGTDRIDEDGINVNSFFIYETDPDFIGDSRFIIEAHAIDDRTRKFYTEVVVRVVPSLLEAVKDVVIIDEGANSVTIDVLNNDIQGIGASSVVSTDIVSDGTTTIIDNQIEFTKASGFTGQTSFNYTIIDASGYKSSGVVTINALDGSRLAGTTQTILTSSGSPVDILFDDSSYALDDGSSLNLGEISRDGAFNYTYISGPAVIGTETFSLVNDQGEVINYLIEIVDSPFSTSPIKDDIIYTSVSTPVSFNPRENDLNADGILIDKSDELVIDGEELVYTPASGYSGVKNFTYTILDGVKELTGNIEIYIGNYLPQRDEYSFITYENIPLVLEYDAPILNYSWSLINQPANGEMSLNVGSSPFIGACFQQVNGNRLANYIPYEGFVGSDNFVIEYCVDNGACKEVNVSVEVLASTESCPCYGNDCVWAGDADNDGKVSVKDILAIGYNYGEIGASRSTPSEDWGSNHAEDWPFQQEDLDINNKFADSNGDGIVDSEDAVVLNSNLNLYHDINSIEVLAQKDVPLIFVPQTEGPYLTGEMILFDVFVGSESVPVEDLKGIVFSAGFPLDLVDPESIKFTPSPHWLGSGSPIISAINISNGLLEVGLSRTTDIGVFGDGQIGTTQLVVVADVDGTKPRDNEIPLVIDVNQARVSNSAGKNYRIDAKSLRLTVLLVDVEKSSSPEVIVYPNPSENVLSFYANNNDELVEIRLFDMMGSLISEYTSIGSRSLEINHQLPQGVYSASIKTQKGFSVQKLQVISTQ